MVLSVVASSCLEYSQAPGRLRVVRRTAVAYCSGWEALPRLLVLADLRWQRSHCRAWVGTLSSNLLLQSIDLVLDLLLLRIQIL